MTHSLTLGEWTLTGDRHFADPTHGFWFEVAAEGTEFGDPEAVTRIVSSLLSDGDIVAYERDGNRTVPVRVMVNGPTLAAVAQGEAALRRATKVRNELTWQPPDTLAPPSVYETHPSSMTREMSATWDLEELRQRRRVFRLNLACAPYARSVSATVVEALSTGTTSVLVDSCDSAAGWTATRGGAPATAGEGPTTFWEGGSVSVAEFSGSVGFPPERWTLTRNGTIDFSTTPYLEVELTTLSAKAGAPLSVQCYAGASEAGPGLPILSARKMTDGSGHFRVVFDASAITSAPALTFAHTSAAGYGHTWQGLLVRNIARTDIAPNITARQLSRIIEVGGTERTPGSLRVSAPDGTSPLNLTIVATWPENDSGFSPPLRRWRTAGNTETVEAGTFSGEVEPIGPFFVEHEIPVRSLPDGTYQLMVLMRASSAGAYVIESLIQSRYNGVTLAETAWRETVSFPVANEWKIVPAGIYGVPIAAAKDGEFKVAFRSLDTTAVQYDEGWLLPVDDDCGLTVLQPTEAHLWLDSPDLTSRVQKVWEGASADKTDAHWPKNGVHTIGLHNFVAPRMVVFTATHGVEWPVASLTYYERWPFNVAED